MDMPLINKDDISYKRYLLRSIDNYVFYTKTFEDEQFSKPIEVLFSQETGKMVSSDDVKQLHLMGIASLDLYINQIGELNARIMQLDVQSERIQEIMKSQILGKDKPPKLNEKKNKSSGGPFINENLTSGDIHIVLSHLLAKVEKREIFYNKKEALLLKHSVLKETLPTLYPVEVPYTSSSFGWRRDPFLGIRAFHSGLDFSAAHGEKIMATGAGIVTMVAKEKNYGNVLKIKHGDGLETRYAHCSKILVKKGDIVERNQVIALVGNTGRSTGPHLDYEIRLNGRALDPRQYLKK